MLSRENSFSVELQCATGSYFWDLWLRQLRAMHFLTRNSIRYDAYNEIILLSSKMKATTISVSFLFRSNCSKYIFNGSQHMMSSLALNTLSYIFMFMFPSLHKSECITPHLVDAPCSASSREWICTLTSTFVFGKSSADSSELDVNTAALPLPFAVETLVSVNSLRVLNVAAFLLPDTAARFGSAEGDVYS